MFPRFFGGGYETVLLPIKLPLLCWLFIAPSELLCYISSGLKAELSSLPLLGSPPTPPILGKPSLLCYVKGEAPPPFAAILFYDEAVRFE